MNKKELIENIQNLESESESSNYRLGFEKAKYWCLTLASNLEESEAEKVEVSECVAEWFEENKGDINQAMYNITIDIHGNRHTTEFEKWFSDSRNDTYGTIVRMKDGYTIKPKRWVVKKGKQNFYFCYFKGESLMPIWVHDDAILFDNDRKNFTDKAKAEAVATLVNGSVKEID
jgi:hypothetical protein|nr:MAG TPA: Protein of unknown function (DUF1642) [Caudoviricetes sp.]